MWVAGRSTRATSREIAFEFTRARRSRGALMKPEIQTRSGPSDSYHRAGLGAVKALGWRSIRRPRSKRDRREETVRDAARGGPVEGAHRGMREAESTTTSTALEADDVGKGQRAATPCISPKVYSSEGRSDLTVVLTVTDCHPKSSSPHWRASIKARDLKRFCEKFIEIN